jgi:hypothetical protein
MHECGTLKPTELILRRAWGSRENNRKDEPNQGIILCIYGNVTMKPLYNYHILIKMFLKRFALPKKIVKVLAISPVIMFVNLKLKIKQRLFKKFISRKMFRV